jgi:hypothetical protein
MSGTIEGNSSRSSGSIAAKGSGITTSSGDPTVSTNPSSLGTMFVNTTSGETYVCSDITAGENVWKNVGDGTGDIQVAFQGESYGYDSGGRTTGPTAKSDVIQKYSFTSDGDGVDVANLSVARDAFVGTQSKTYGFCAGGGGADTLKIDKHQFATTNDATTVGDLHSNGYHGGGVSGNDGYGYHVTGNEPVDNVIQRYSYSSDGTGTDVGNMSRSSNAVSCASDWGASYGYCAGGVGPVNVIDRFAFGSSSSGSDVGDLVLATDTAAPSSSLTHGYIAGGYGGGVADMIQNYAFASSGAGADIGNLFQARYHPAGTSSTTHGYASGGNYSTGTAYTQTIDKWSFASGTQNAGDVADLTEKVHTASAGTHV